MSAPFAILMLSENQAKEGNHGTEKKRKGEATDGRSEVFHMGLRSSSCLDIVLAALPTEAAVRLDQTLPMTGDRIGALRASGGDPRVARTQ